MSFSSTTALNVTFRGVRGSMPSPGARTTRYGGNTSCVEVRFGDEILIFDAGTGIRGLGTDLVAEFGAMPIAATLLISHTHWDHIQGLPFFVPAYSTQNRIRVITAIGSGAKVRRALHNQMDPIHFPVGLDQLCGLTDIEELGSDDIALGPFRVRTIELNHPGGCAGFRVQANGGSFAYFSDHEPFEGGSANLRTNAFVEFLRGVDLLILDTQYTEAEYRHRRGWGHGCLTESVTLAMDAGVKQLALFHHDPDHDDNQIDAIVETAMKLAASTPLVVYGAIEHEKISLDGTNLSLVREPLPARTG
jgi:phosphoribosyl 1,2-cyclic phosphodiesterase